MVRGEELRVLLHYDLYGSDLSGSKGIYLKTDEKSGKHLVYFPDCGEWAELTDSEVEPFKKGRVTKKNKEFISRIETLKITYEA